MVALVGAERVEAARGMPHRAPYCCPECRQPVVLHARLGGWVIPHFKHKAKSACSYGKGETKEHRAVKDLLRSHYRALGHEVILEHTIGVRRADVFVTSLGVAFEVEFSQKEARDAIAKCRDYAGGQVKSVWVLRQKRFAPSDIEVGKSVVISTSPVSRALCNTSRIRPRGAKIAFFAYDKSGVVVFRGVLSSLMLYKEEDPYSGAGGYEYPSRSREWLLVKEVIRYAVPPPEFQPPSGERTHPTGDAVSDARSMAA
jgi:hypothetical protein